MCNNPRSRKGAAQVEENEDNERRGNKHGVAWGHESVWGHESDCVTSNVRPSEQKPYAKSTPTLRGRPEMSDATAGGDMQSAQCETRHGDWEQRWWPRRGRVEISKTMSCTPYVYGRHADQKGQNAMLDGPNELRGAGEGRTPSAGGLSPGPPRRGRNGGCETVMRRCSRPCNEREHTARGGRKN